MAIETVRRYGYMKGIQGRDNSCYLDSTLMALFYGSSGLDSTFLASYKDLQDPVVKSIRKCTNLVVQALRTEQYCPFTVTLQLRHSLASLNPKFRGEMIDVEEFLSTFCTKGLQLPKFICCNSGNGNYFHQIILKNSPIQNSAGHLQLLLRESLEMQNLQISELSRPLFMVKMPRSNGKLIKYSGIVPPLELAIPVTTGTRMMHLQAVICLRYCHYTCFIRSKKQWVYYDSMAAGGQPEVIYLDDMEQSLQQLQNTPMIPDVPHSATRSKRLLKQLVTDIHFCIYVIPQPAAEFGFVNSNNNIHVQTQTVITPTPQIIRPPIIRPNGQTVPRFAGHQHTPIRPTVRVQQPFRHPQTEIRQVQRYPTTPRIPTMQPQTPTTALVRTSTTRHPPTRNGQKPFDLIAKIKKMASSVADIMKEVLFGGINYDLNNSMVFIVEREIPEEEYQKIERIGSKKGIEKSLVPTPTVFALEAVIFSLFSNTRSNDFLFETYLHSLNARQRKVAECLRHVVHAIRYSPCLCSKEVITQLHQVLLCSQPPLATGIDSEAIIHHIFKRVLPQNPFIKYHSGQAFIHNLIVPTLQNNFMATTESLFYKSMNNPRLMLDGVPRLLILKMNKKEGKLVGTKYIIPSLTLSTNPVDKNRIPMPISMDLIAVICRNEEGNHVSFVRYNSDQSSVNEPCWIEMGLKENYPKVKPWPKLSKHLKSTEAEMRRKDQEDNHESIRFLKFCKNVDVCIYNYWEFVRKPKFTK